MRCVVPSCEREAQANSLYCLPHTDWLDSSRVCLHDACSHFAERHSDFCDAHQPRYKAPVQQTMGWPAAVTISVFITSFFAFMAYMLTHCQWEFTPK